MRHEHTITFNPEDVRKLVHKAAVEVAREAGHDEPPNLLGDAGSSERAQVDITDRGFATVSWFVDVMVVDVMVVDEGPVL